MGLVTNMNNCSWLDEENLEQFAQSIEGVTGLAGTMVVGYIDGHQLQISKPTWNQHLLYSGKSRTHALKSITLVYPNGIGFNIGSGTGHEHDIYCFRRCDCNRKIADALTFMTRTFRVYADKGFQGEMSNILWTPFPGRRPEQMEWNRKMNSGRQAVECYFACVRQSFPLLRNRYLLKIFKSPVLSYWHLGVFFTNLKCIISPNQISSYFNVPPPSLETYLRDID
jgi:hypothetical protein